MENGFEISVTPYHVSGEIRRFKYLKENLRKDVCDACLYKLASKFDELSKEQSKECEEVIKRRVITSEQPTEHSQSESHREEEQKASACGQSEPK